MKQLQMNTENNTIIKIDHVSKKYRLGTIGGTTLKDEIHRKTAKLLHKEDPTLIIGKNPVLSNEEFYALKDVSLEVKKGEAVGIIGRNGAGKSTLLKLLCRVTAPTEGVIAYNGRITSMLEVGTGFHPELTGRENIYLNGAILGMNRKEIDSKIENIIEFSECSQFIDTPVKRYSSGMKVKLAFSVSAHLDSEIMIMDEVLAVGDVAFQKKCLTKMREAASKEGRTVLYVSHNMNTIRQLCDRCVVMEQGKVIFDGEVEDAIQLYLSADDLSSNAIDLSNIERSTMFSDGTVLMTMFSVESEDSYYKTGSKIKACLVITSKKDLSGIRLEIPVRTMGGISVTRFVSAPIITLKEGDENRVFFTLDIASLAPGRYSFSPVLRGMTDWGTQIDYDGMSDIYNFEIIPTAKFNDGVEWNTYYSGFFVAPDIEIVDQSHE